MSSLHPCHHGKTSHTISITPHAVMILRQPHSTCKPISISVVPASRRTAHSSCCDALKPTQHSTNQPSVLSSCLNSTYSCDAILPNSAPSTNCVTWCCPHVSHVIHVCDASLVTTQHLQSNTNLCVAFKQAHNPYQPL